MTPKKGRGIGAYLLVVVVLIVALVFLLNGLKTGGKETKYSDIMKYFDNYEVTAYTLDLGSGELKLTLDDGDKLTYDVPNVSVFRDDTKDYRTSYNQKHPDAPLQVDYYKIRDTSWLLTLIPTLVLLGLMIFLFVFMMRQANGGGKYTTFGKANIKNQANTRKATFADVAGADEEKHELEEIVDFLKNPRKYAELGARIPKGVLLMGPPGTGKTLLARAVAGEAGCPFFSISGSDFVEMFVGVGASRVRDLFDQAKKNAPSIIFIDEIDAVGRHRGTGIGGGHDEREQTLNQLLAEMDGFDSSKGILILAATNRPEILDPALLRPGRFDRRVIVERPDLKGRVNILKVHAKDVSLDETVDLDAIALATSGAVGSDLANMINEAAILAVKNGRKAVSQKDLYEAVEVVLVGKEKKDRILSQEERRIVSYHEVGHALVSALQKDAEPVQKITIVPRTMGALGYVMQVPEEEKYLNTKAELEAMLVGLLGGRAAEEVVFGNVTTGASNDIEKATQIAKAMITQYGMSEKFGLMGLASVEHEYLNGRATLNCGDATATEIDHEVMKMLKESYEQAKQMLCEHRKTLDKIAAFLIERETITGKEFMEIFHEAEGIEGKEPEPAETAVEATTETPDAEPMTEAALQEEEVTADPVSDTPEEKKVQEPVKEDSQESPIQE